MQKTNQQRMMRKLAVIAAVQYLSKDLDELEIGLKHINDVYGLARYPSPRVREMKRILHELFSECKVIYHTGSHGEPGFDGFKVRCVHDGTGEKKKFGKLEIIDPDEDTDLSFSDKLDYNLILASSTESPWKRNSRD